MPRRIFRRHISRSLPPNPRKKPADKIPIEIESALFVVGETVLWSVPLGYLLGSYLCYRDEDVRERWLSKTSQSWKKFLPDPVYRYAERRLRGDKETSSAGN